MASETYFGDGQLVMLSNSRCKGEPNEKALLALRGRIAEVDESARECCYYRVVWDASPKELATLGIDEEDFVQSDDITNARKVR